MHTQNQEEKFITEYFGDIKGTLLSIGENDGKTFSNALRLIELGWNAVLVEPSETAFGKMKELHKNRRSNVICLKYAVSDKEGEQVFYESGSHLHNLDSSLLSSLDASEIKRWEESGETFSETKVDCITYAGLLEKVKPISTFQFISIDAEGVDIIILKQIDLSKTMLLCIEWNLDKQKAAEIQQYCLSFGLNKVIYASAENLLLGRS
jgi:FkbM family methyltransferase